MKNQGEKKTKKQKKTKCQEMKMKAPTFEVGVYLGHFCCKVGDFLRFLTQTYPPGGVRADHF